MKTILRGNNPDVLKMVMELKDGITESVLYKYPTYEERTVMCISTQVGCPMGCSFCGTGKFFARNLTSEEIIQQVFELEKEMDIELHNVKRAQIMFMSMGEPLLNFPELKKAVEMLYENYPKAALLVSSSGPDTLYWTDFMFLARDIPTVGLQFSVHESTDAARDKLIPMKKKLDLDQIAGMGQSFFDYTGRQPFFNYCVHPDNSTDGDIRRLSELFDPAIWQATLSVICESDETQSEAVARHLELVQDFAGRLVQEGYSTRVFNPAGQDDIGGGCGQLWQVQRYAEEHPEIMRQSPGDKIRCRS